MLTSKEKAAARVARWRAKHPERAKEVDRRAKEKWRKNCPEKIKQYQANYREKNREVLAAKQRERTFGITMQEYADMFHAQNGGCAICAKPERTKRNGKVKALSVDHDHETGAIRGLLCHDCNTAIGKLYEDRNLFLSAIRYLDKHSGKKSVMAELRLVEGDKA